MASYTQYTLASLSNHLGQILDDDNELYWVAEEKKFAIWESLRVFGALTNNWRKRGVFDITPTTTWYDLNTQLPLLRPRTWTLDQVVKQMQYMILENPSGISGAGMSGQIDITSILQAVQRARNQFVVDVMFPFTVHPPADFGVIPPEGLIEIPDTVIATHRLSFSDNTSGTWTNLWREDAWAADHNNPIWTIDQNSPVAFSQSELSPLELQLIPAPLNGGNLEMLSIDSLQIDLTDPDSTFNIPDEWIHAVMYAALADIHSAGQLDDYVRFTYCTNRYNQAVDAARMARSVIRLQINGLPLPMDTMTAIDNSRPFWRNQTGTPSTSGVLYDLLAFANMPDATYSIAADVVQAAPLPVLPGDPIQIGPEDIPSLVNYAVNILTLKCGGNEFLETMKGYDDFLAATVARNRALAVKARYMQPIFAQPQLEQAQRPELMGAKRA